MKLRNIRNTQTGITTFGAFWDKGALQIDAVENIVCLNEKSEQVPIQTRITAYWPDSSVKWTAHTTTAELLGKEIEIKLDATHKASNDGMVISKEGNDTIINTNKYHITLDGSNRYLFKSVSRNGQEIWRNAMPIIQIMTPSTVNGHHVEETTDYVGMIKTATIEENGPIAFVIKYEGCHKSDDGREAFPFVIRMRFSNDGDDISFTHTFMYDGDEDKDFLTALGVSFEATMSGKYYNRHVKFMNEYGIFHEGLVNLTSWRPRIPEHLYEMQMRGERTTPNANEQAILDKVMQDTPYWDEYSLTQDSVCHYGIKKKLSGDQLCYIDCLHGSRTKGGAAIGSDLGSTIVGIRDFWEKYPTGINFKNLTTDKAQITIWLWSPDAQPMDFRHYADRGYNQVCYEGYDYKGASAYGIAVTNEFVISFAQDQIAADQRIVDVTDSINSPAIYVASPEFYHEHGVFGYWSLPDTSTETEQWIEDQLDKAFNFYKNEVEQRNWYGMFNYGDFMHTYDSFRHVWKYDIGGYAWDNTELVPTLWLWLYFMRTGREDVFSLAEKLSRHASEVDVYHFGKYKGLGSRHNVRHWGCPCKEARIAMAGHHRYMYYLTGDRRLEDIFDELKDNEESFLNRDPLGDFYDKEKMKMPSHARSGPDWSSLVSNWMMEWERHGDTRYRDKILVGLQDIKNAPLKLTSGPDFEFDPKTYHLGYIGEITTGGCHLQVCMGAPSIWMETADLLGDEEFKKMLADHGRFYFLPHDKQLEETGGLIGDRQSTLPMLSCAMGAYGAKYLSDEWLGQTTWKILLETMIQGGNSEGFVPKTLDNTAGREHLQEIKWVTTNFTAQWCLNAIMTLDFIKDSLPETIDDVRNLVRDAEPDKLYKS